MSIILTEKRNNAKDFSILFMIIGKMKFIKKEKSMKKFISDYEKLLSDAPLSVLAFMMLANRTM